MIKVNFNEMTNADYKALLDNNSVVDKLILFTTEETSLMINDWLDILDGLGDYSLSDSSQYNYMCVRNSYRFLQSVSEVQKEYALLDDEMAEKAQKAMDDYENSELDPEDDDKLDEAAEKVANALVEFAQAQYDGAMEDDYLIEAMKEFEALNTLYGDDGFYNRENNRIYYMLMD